MKSVIKISISMESMYTHIEDVIYYRTGTPDQITRWMWYYEYIAALVKVANPRRRVVLYTGPLTVLIGKEWHECRRQTLLKSKDRKLKRLRSMNVEADLFGLGEEFRQERISKVEADIAALAADTYPIGDFPEYINTIKLYLK